MELQLNLGLRALFDVCIPKHSYFKADGNWNNGNPFEDFVENVTLRCRGHAILKNALHAHNALVNSTRNMDFNCTSKTCALRLSMEHDYPQSRSMRERKTTGLVVITRHMADEVHAH